MRFAKYNNTTNNVNHFFLLLFIFWLPLKDNFLPLLLFFWILTWLLEGNFKKRFNQYLPSKPLLLALIIYFLLTCFALFISTSFDDGILEVQQKLSLVFFPILIIGSRHKIKENLNTILLIFIIGILAASLFCLANATASSISINNGIINFEYWPYPEFKGESFWKLVNIRFNNYSSGFLSIFIHPSYFAMFLVFSICILLFFIKHKLVSKTIHKVGVVILITFFLLMIYLLQSRAGIMSLVIVFLIFVTIEIKRKFKKRYLILVLIVIPLLGLLLFSSSKLKRNFTELKEIYADPSGYSIEKVDVRYRVWFSSLKVIEENFWLGTSPANLIDELVVKYNELGYEDAGSGKLNSHNQYLETFAGLGVFGFLSLMFILVYGFVISIKQRHYLLFFLMLILSVNFLFESMMNRMSGILFMMLFISIFVFVDIPMRNNTAEKTV